jgi:hypothetical protein
MIDPPLRVRGRPDLVIDSLDKVTAFIRPYDVPPPLVLRAFGGRTEGLQASPCFARRARGGSPEQRGAGAAVGSDRCHAAQEIVDRALQRGSFRGDGPGGLMHGGSRASGLLNRFGYRRQGAGNLAGAARRVVDIAGDVLGGSVLLVDRSRKKRPR